MSSFRLVVQFLRYVVISLVAGSVLTACQIRPLYSDLSGARQSISISDPTDRVGQVVRNELIFAFSGGGGEPANPQYKMDLKVAVFKQGVLPAKTADEFNAARVEVTANYDLRDSATGETLFSGQRRAVAALDNPDQDYGNTRATLDAENRAAREVAAFIQLDVTGKLASRIN